MTHVIEVPFHIGDFLSGTMHMDATEVGAYWMLCVAHYQAGEQGLPDDDVKMARIAKVSLKTWKRIRPTLAEKFIIKDGFWRSSKVVDVLLKISARSSKAKANALKRWNDDDATALPEQCNGNANHITTNHLEDTNVSSPPISPIEDDAGAKPEATDPAFEKFWEAYPRQRRGSKEKARKAYLRALSRASPEEIHAACEAYAASDEVRRGFAKGCEAWLNDDRWTVDYSAKQGGNDGRSKNGNHGNQAALGGKSERARRAAYAGLGLTPDE